MSGFGRALTGPILLIIGLAYFLMLVVALLVLRLAPELVLGLTLAGIALIAISLRPYLGVHVFVLTMFLENVLGGTEGLSPMKVIGGVVLAGWLVNMAIRRTTGLRFGGLEIALLLFLLWSGISLVYALDTRVAMGGAFSCLQFVLATLMFGSVVDTPLRIRRVYISFLVAATLSAVVAVIMYYRGNTLVASGLVGNRNLLAMYGNIAIVCAYLLFQVVEGRLARLALIAALPTLFLGIGLTFSRGGLISLGVTLLVVWYRVARQRYFLLIASSVALLCVLTYVLPMTFWQRAESILPALRQEQSKDTFSARVKLWQVAARMIADRPIVGVGPRNFVVAFPRYARGSEMIYQALSTHNAFMSVGAEYGLVGGGIFLTICGLAISAARRGYKVGRGTARSDLGISSVISEVSLIAMFLAGLSGNVEGLKCLWMFFGLALATGRMAEREIANRASEGSVERPDALADGGTRWVLARPGD